MVQQQQTFKSLSIIFIAMLIGQVSFTLIAYFLVSTGRFDSSAQELEDIFTLMVPVLIIGGWLGGKFLYDKKIQAVSANITTAEKLEVYRLGVIMRFAMLEGPVLLGIIGYVVTGKELLLVFAAGGILLFLFLKPSKEKTARALQVSEGEL